jgi:hypothetical protein
MLCLVLGTSTHAFELMLSAFILGLALGGLWIQRRIDRLAHPVRYLAMVQLAMGSLALLTVVLYGNTFEVMQWLVKNLSRTGTGYALFNLSSSAIAMAIMLPATFCAGMTLPLITFTLIRQGWGERSIGAVYAANTVGAIIGVFFFIPNPPADVLSSGVKLRINFVRMYEEPAQAFIFHTQDENSTFVWVERPKPGEVL